MDPGTTSRDPILGGGRGRVLLFCWLGWVFDFHDLILFSFVKPAVAGDLGLDLDSTVAWIEGLTLLATAVSGFLFGRFADRHGRRRALALGILVYSFGALLTALAQDVASLLLARLVTGLGVGGEWGIGHAVVAETWRGRARDRVHGLLQAGSPVAMGLAAVTGFFLAPAIGWRGAFLLSALPALLAFAARWAMPGPDHAPARLEAALPARALLQPGLLRPTAVLFLILLLHMTGFWCVYAELPAALQRQLQVPPQRIGVFQLIVNAVHVVADVGFGLLAARFGQRRMFVACCLLFAGAQLLLALMLPALAQHFGLFTLGAAAIGLGAGTWSSFGAMFGAHYPAAVRATAAATLYNAARGAQLFAKPLLAALFACSGSFAPALWVGAACAAGSALLIRWLPRP